MKQVVYTASPESQQIHVWQLNGDEGLTLLQVVEVPGEVQPMVLNRQQNILYVGVRPDFRVIAWKIDHQGLLSELSPVALPGSATYLSVDQQGRYLFASYYHDGLVSVSKIDDKGIPGEPEQIIEGLAGCHSINPALNNQTLFAPALKQDRICLFTLTEQGKLVPVAQQQLETEAGAGPRHMAFHPGQQYAYSVNELNGCVDIWSLCEADGIIKKIQSVDIMPPDFNGTRWAADIHLTPDGRYLYACDRTASIITGFKVESGGAELILIGYQPTETQPRGFNLDLEGRYLIAAGQKSHHITLYKIDSQSGDLHPIARYATGQGPMWVECHQLSV